MRARAGDIFSSKNWVLALCEREEDSPETKKLFS
jgi:hypothetical protein